MTRGKFKVRATILFTAAIALVSITQVSASERRSMYGVVEVENIEPSENAQWEFLENTRPLYPKELAMSKVMGCAITSFEISDSGQTKKVRVVSSVPIKGLEKPVGRMIKQVKWQPVVEGDSPGEERRVMRFNFCMSEDSNEEAHALCAKVSKLPCE